MLFRLVAPLAASFMLSGGVQATSNIPASATNTTEMTSVVPQLNSEQVLTHLLELIRSSERVEEFTPERLTEVFGVPFRVFEPGYWGFGEFLSPRWSYSMQGWEAPPIGARFSFEFNDGPGDDQPIDEICGLDYARFTSELESMGFTRRPFYGEHGRFISDRFNRPGMDLVVYPLGERVPPGADPGRICVKTVQVL